MVKISSLAGKFNMKIFLSLAVPWVVFWYLPWVASLASLPWLRVGLAGIVFIAPGMSVSLLLTGNRFTLLSHFINGLTLSMFLVSLLGVIGRIAHLPFDFIKLTFFVSALIALVALAFHTRSTQQLYKSGSFSFTSIVLILLMILFGSMISLTSRIENDDFTHLSYLTNWQYSPRLNFGEVVFGSGNLEGTRWWLAMFPMNQAFLAEISNVHGVLLIGYYLRPVLVAISLLAIYNFYEDLLQSDLRAVMAVLVQFTLLFLLLGLRQPGSMFFLRATEDKTFAAFTMAPVFFMAVRCFLESPVLRKGIFVLLSGWSLALIHPVILAYCSFIIGLYAILVKITRKEYKTLGIVLALLVLVLLPSASLRLVPFLGIGPQYAFDLESALGGLPIGDRISYIKGTPFYGLNLNTLRIPIGNGTAFPWAVFLSWSYVWLLGLGFLWSLLKLKKQDPIAPFVSASAVLVILCAIPYTGWLIGYFVSPRMLWRSPWLFPIGLVAVNLVMEALKAISSKMTDAARQEVFTQRNASISILVTCIVLIGYFSIYKYQKKWQRLERFQEYRIMLEEKVVLGNYIEANIEQPSIFLASYEMMNYLPGLSSKAKVVYFRSFIYTHHPVSREKINLVLSTDESFSLKKRMEVLRKYRIQYLLIEDASLKEYYAAYPEFFKMQKVGNAWLFEYREMLL